MKNRTRVVLLIAAWAFAVTGIAGAATINVWNDITVSEEWTPDNLYSLQSQVHVTNGATLTIQAGTVVASQPGGSLVICGDGMIIVQGTATDPVIMTSVDDRWTWNNWDPATGYWRAECREWGNLSILGEGVISASHYDGSPVDYDLDPDGPGGAPSVNYVNEKVPSTSPDSTVVSRKVMEGLIPTYTGDPKVLYGGLDDDDDSGEIHYLSIRYGGYLTADPNKELNGLSLGAVGRETEIDHVEIMNNVDDGIEIWGGTVELKNIAIWNVGDDSFDVDEGWRGKAQFGLIVQGHSDDSRKQGSGIGDNCIETDGAEDSDAQPVTTAGIYNFTVIGQPIDGDGGTAWRDNARVQYRNCIFMDLGEKLVRPDGDDGDGANGYGYNGTLSWAETWATPAGTHSTVNTGGMSPAELDALYPVQTDGMLAEITDCVFYNNNHADAYTEADALGVRDAANNNVTAAGRPIKFIGRGPQITVGPVGEEKDIVPVVALDPMPMNDAVTSVGSAPSDGFFTPAAYRGAFDPSGSNWLKGWTAADAFGFLVDADTLSLGTAGAITSDPADLSWLAAGEVVTLTAPVTAAEGGSNYHWKKDGVLLAEDAPRVTGTSSDTLVFNPVNASDSGTYTVIYEDGSKTLVESEPFTIAIATDVPVAGLAGAASLVALLLAGGALATARKKH